SRPTTQEPAPPMPTLNPSDVETYRQQGYLLVENALAPEELSAIRAAIDGFIEQSRSLTQHDIAIELEAAHRADRPQVRGLNLPHKLHPAFAKLCRSPSILDPVRALIGPNLRLLGSKVNIKAAEAGTSVEWHQDWAFYPHSNDDLLAVGVL